MNMVLKKRKRTIEAPVTYEERTYRKYFKAEGLVGFEVIEKETDLYIFADSDLSAIAMQAVLKYGTELQGFILAHEKFATSFSPVRVPLTAPQIVKEMAGAAKKANVGPMAAWAGAIAEKVGSELLRYSKEVIVENGGDIFMKINKPRKIGVFAGTSAFSEKLALEIDPKDTPCGICTASGTVGHSISFGKADAVCIIAKSASLADAAATAVANAVKDVSTIKAVLETAKKIRGLKGVLIIKDDQMGIQGKIRIHTI